MTARPRPQGRPVARLFLDHPAAVDETYLEHMAFAARFAGSLCLAAGAALVHAVVPALCERTASGIVARLHERTRTRGR